MHESCERIIVTRYELTRAWIEPYECEHCGGWGFTCLRCTACGRTPLETPSGFYRLAWPDRWLTRCAPCFERELAG